MIDLYHERCGPGPFAESLNAATNLAFLVAAFLAWRLARRLGVRSAGIAVLIALSIAIGIGNALFHTFATPWLRVPDLVPILAFQLVFLRQYLRWCVVATSRTLAYLSVCLLVLRVPMYFSGSVIYAPTLPVLMGSAVFHLRTGQPGRRLSRVPIDRGVRPESTLVRPLLNGGL